MPVGDATHYAELTIDATKVDAVIPYTVVYLSNLDATFWANVQADGDDIRFTEADGTTEVPFTKIAIDTSTELGLYLVKCSSFISTSTNATYRIHWGNASASAYGPTDTYGRNAVFSDYAAFYTPGMSLTDLTGNGYDLTAVNTPGTAASGLEGLTAATYNGTNQYHWATGPVITALPLTMEFLGKGQQITANQTVLGIADSASTNDILSLGLGGAESGDPARFVCRGSSGGTVSTALSTTGYSSGTLAHFAAVRSGVSSGTVYIDGGSAATDTATITAISSPNRVGIGALPQATPTLYAQADVAFAAMSSSARSADYVATVNRTWTDSGFTTYGASVAHSGAGTTDGYAGTVSNVDYLSGTAWSNPTNAQGSNTGTFASAAIPTGEASDRLWATNYDNAAIPADANINEIRAYVYRQDADGDSEVNDSDLRLIVGGSVVGTSKGTTALWPFTAAESAAYTWAQAEVTSLGITAANVKANNFGIALAAVEGSPGFAADARVYYVRMEVDYTAASAVDDSAWFMLA